MSLQHVEPNKRESGGLGIVPALVVVFLISIYPILRYGGSWNVGGDTFNFTFAIRSILESGNLVTPGQVNYPNGYGYQVLSVFILNLTGLDLPEWQIFGAIFLITWMVFPAWLLYREWVGSNVGATLATIFLFTQPELLFGIMRGTHEKFTRGLILLCLYLLTYSLRSRQNTRRFVASLLAFYLCAYALITFNNLFSTSFLSAVLLSLVMAWVLAWWTKSYHTFRPTMQRLSYVIVISFVLASIYSFYVYSPAKQNLVLLQTITDRVAALFLDVQSTSSYNPYAGPVFRAWVSPFVFLLLSLANWILLIGSSLIWAAQSVRWLLKRQAPSSDSELLLWAFYGAFALQGGLTVLADVSGALSGNLQHRMFPTISLMGVAVIARWMLPIFQSEHSSLARVARTATWIGICFLSLLTLAKATNEPVLSNQWATYLPAEVSALDWAESKLADRSVWTGFDRRLVEVVHIRSGALPRSSKLDRFDVEADTDNFLVSEIIRLQVPRLGVSLPIRTDDLITFDNGQAQIYHRRPQTPYRR